MERLIVFVLLLLLPTQLAYHFWPQSSYILGLRVDYLSPAIYLTDFLIILLIPYIKKRFNFIYPVLFFALINTVFAEFPFVSLLKWLTVFKLIILGTYFYSCDLNKLKKTITSALSLSLITISLIGLLQFIFQRTVGGPLYYLGERSFTSLTPGIALMDFFGRSLMRAYSTFSHPNSFAGFVVVSFLIILSFSKKRFFYLCFFLVLSLLLTVSLNAVVGILTAGVFVLLFKKFKTFLPVVLITVSILLGAFSTTLPNNLYLESNVKERIVLAGRAVDVFVNKPLVGVGLNNFFSVTKNIQPPHNVYLIIPSETGILGMLLFYFLLTKLLRKSFSKYILMALFFVLFTGFFDHYWFTLQQNELVLSILLGLSVRNYNNEDG